MSTLASQIVTLKIDGKDCGARGDETILTVARENGIDIPTLCHFDGLTDIGACRICLVEVKGSPKLFPACTTLVTEGMEVFTNSRAPAALPQADPGTALHRAEPRLLGVREQRPLRTAGHGAEAGPDACASAVSLSQPEGGREPRPLRAG